MPAVSWNMINNRNGHVWAEGTNSIESAEESTYQIRPNTPIKEVEINTNDQKSQEEADLRGLIIQRVRLPSRNLDQLRHIQ